MKVKELVLKKVPLYLNEKYYPIFVDILQNIQQNPKIFETSTISKMFNGNQTTKNRRNFFSQDSLSSFESINNFTKKNNNNSSALWKQLITSIFKETEYNCITYSELEIRYLKYKANQIYTKLNSLSYEIKKPINNLIEIYLNETQKIIDNIINQRLLDKEIKELQNHKKELDKKNDKDFTNKTLEMELNQKILLRKKSINNIVKQMRDDSDDEKEQEKAKMLNLFFDKVDLEKYFQKEQIAEIKRGEFANAIINHNHCFTQQFPRICKSAKRKILKKENNNKKNYINYANSNKRIISFNKNKNEITNKIEPLKKLGTVKENKKLTFDSFNEKTESNYLPKLKYNELQNLIRLEKKMTYTAMNKTGNSIFNKKRNLLLNDSGYSKNFNFGKNSNKSGKNNNSYTNRMVFNFINKKDLYY